jgi:hypothetical protein
LNKELIMAKIVKLGERAATAKKQNERARAIDR